MPRFPYMHFPFPLYKNSFREPAYSNNFSRPYMHYDTENSSNTSISGNTRADTSNVQISNIVSENRDFKNFDEKNKSSNNTNDYLFDLFGLKIYSDDVLLVSLIYFLYSEDVKDDGLFLVLILLLLG